MIQWWLVEPTGGGIFWCCFPDSINPKPKPRPAFILNVFGDVDLRFHVAVVYETNKGKHDLRRGEFAILKVLNAAAYKAASSPS